MSISELSAEKSVSRRKKNDTKSNKPINTRLLHLHASYMYIFLHIHSLGLCKGYEKAPALMYTYMMMHMYMYIYTVNRHTGTINVYNVHCTFTCMCLKKSTVAKKKQKKNSLLTTEGVPIIETKSTCSR